MLKRTAIFITLLFSLNTIAEQGDLSPVLVEKGALFLQENFADINNIAEHKILKNRQGTTWVVENGILVGSQSSQQFQTEKAKKGRGHTGTTPRLQFVGSPKDFIIKYDFKINEGRTTKLIPMIESGHHLRRLYFGSKSTQILTENEKTIVTETGFTLKQDTWYQILIEIKDNEMQTQIKEKDGQTITLYGKHQGIAKKHKNYDIGITGPNTGFIYIDNLSVWSAGNVKSK